MLRRTFLAGLLSSISASALAAGQKSRPRARQPSQRSMRSAQSMVKRAPQTGHLKRKHLGKSVSHLKQRAVRAAKRSVNKKSAKKIKSSAAAQKVLAARSQRKKVKNRYSDFSSFSSQKQMQSALARALDQNRNKIRKYINSGGKGRISISTKVGKGAGVIYRGASGKLVQPSGATFSISKQGNRLSVFTGYLTKHKKKR